MGRLSSLIVMVGLAYGALYLYYGAIVGRAVEERLGELGLAALEIERVRYGPLAPVLAEASVSVDVFFRGAEASIDIRVFGHPLVSDELRLELEGMQALRLMIGRGD